MSIEGIQYSAGDSTVPMTSWTACGHGDAPTKHSHFVPGHGLHWWWQQYKWLSWPCLLTATVNRLGSPWKILRDHKCKGSWGEMVGFWDSVSLRMGLHSKIRPCDLRILGVVVECSRPPLPPGHAGAHAGIGMRDGACHILPGLLNWSQWAKGLSHP